MVSSLPTRLLSTKHQAGKKNGLNGEENSWGATPGVGFLNISKRESASSGI